MSTIITMNAYQENAMTTCMESSNNVAYMFLNLVGEVGELAEKMADNMINPAWVKALRDLASLAKTYGDTAKCIRKEPNNLMSADIRAAFGRVAFIEHDDMAEVSKEIGDIMWQLNGLMTVLNLKAEDVAQQNQAKLASRQKRGKIDGNGDNR